jgi:RNA polymerase sigma-70 factor (ECF subfamily)
MELILKVKDMNPVFSIHGETVCLLFLFAYEEIKMNICDIYNNYYKYIFNYSLKLTCHPEDALDLTQDTFLKAMGKLDTLENEHAIASWLRTICFHEFLNRASKDPKKYLVEPHEWEILEQEGQLLTDVILQPEDEIIVEEEVRSLQNGCFLAMVRRLTLHQRIVFSLVDMYGLSIDHVARILDLSKGAAKGLLYRARMNIDSFFADHCDIIYEKNPCACKAWMEFSLKRSNLQNKARILIDKLDYEQKNYIYDEKVRKRVLYLYSHMPEQRPSEEWYQSVLTMLMPD